MGGSMYGFWDRWISGSPIRPRQANPSIQGSNHPSIQSSTCGCRLARSYPAGLEAPHRLLVHVDAQSRPLWHWNKTVGVHLHGIADNFAQHGIFADVVFEEERARQHRVEVQARRREQVGEPGVRAYVHPGVLGLPRNFASLSKAAAAR